MTPQKPQHISAEQTVFFGIPLKARATAKNWDWTVRDFNRTLASVYNQTNPNFRILVGCHDIPDLLIPTDERLEFLRVDSSTPDLQKDPQSIFPDKARKLRRVGDRFRQAGGCWYMTLDADDLVSSQLVEFVLRHPNPNGSIARQGYLLDQESRVIALIPEPNIFAPAFDRIAGCVVFRFNEKDFLPTQDQVYSQPRFDRYVVFSDHRTFWDMSLKENRPLRPFPFPAYVYVLNTGQNHSFNHGPSRNWLVQQLIPALRLHGTVPAPDLIRDFALDSPVWASPE
jgi:hypothetical protein